MIQTVKGPIDPSQLGVTLIHEHLCLNGNGKYDEQVLEYQYRLLQQAVDAGVKTLVDLTPLQNVDKVLRLQERLPELNIILSTGAYVEGGGRYLFDSQRRGKTPDEVDRFTEDEMVRHMTKNLTQGYDGYERTGVRAGIIKVAANKPALTDWEKKNFRAAARVQTELKVPIATHACAGAREQMRFLQENGTHIPATFYSHVEATFGWEGRTLEQEAEYLAEITRAGGYVQFNNFDFEFDTPWADLVGLIDALDKKGFGDRMFISIDVNWEVDADGKIWHEAQREHPVAGRRTYAYTLKHAVPKLRAAGVSQPRIDRFLVENPRRFFSAWG
jgi:phosphotriesterase-related protein